MGKTRKRIPYSCFRRPKGWKRAKINNARWGSVPPNAWDDAQHCHSISQFWDLLREMYCDKRDWSEIIDSLSKKFRVSKTRILSELKQMRDTEINTKWGYRFING